MAEPLTSADLRIVPANEAAWEDLAAVFGTAGDPYRCQCQWFRVPPEAWRTTPLEERRELHRAATACDDPDAPHTSGLVAYLGDEPVGWVAVEPRIAYPRLRTSRVPWAGREEDKDDEGVWAITCFHVRTGYRGRGITYALAEAAATHALDRGATAVEGYPMTTRPGVQITWGELYVGAVQVFEEAGFTEVSAPTKRRRVLRRQ